MCIRDSPGSYESRAQLLWSASLAITHLSDCGREYAGCVHSIEHALSAFLDISHGVSLSLIHIFLRMLVTRPGQTLTREILNEGIWQEGSDYIDENALSVTVARLRKKLKLSGEECPIRTVYGIGYVWERGKER